MEAIQHVEVTISAVVWPRCPACERPNPDGAAICDCGRPTPPPRDLGVIARSED